MGGHTSDRNDEEHGKVKVKNDFQDDQRQHGLLFHADNADPISAKVGDAAKRHCYYNYAYGYLREYLLNIVQSYHDTVRN